MVLSPLFVLILGWIASFLGTLPFGPINLSVVDTTIKKSFYAGLQFSIAAAIVEIFQAMIALHCNMLISHFFTTNPWTKMAAVALFIGLGLFFFLKKATHQTEEDSGKRKNNYIRGVIIAVLNPQAIPFWIFVLSYVESTYHIFLSSYSGWFIVGLFLVGVSLGKLAALMLFGVLSKLICEKSSFLNLWMNKIIGSILIAIGLFQAAQVILV